MKNESKSDYLGTKDNSSYPDTIAIINCVLNAPLMLTAITGNSLVLVAILRTPSLRSPSTVFLGSLAVSDLLVGLVVQPLFISSELKFRSFLVDASYKILSVLACGVSIFTMATISVDRFLALRYHMRYPDLMTKNRAIFISATFWFISFLLSSVYLLSRESYSLAISISIASCLLHFYFWLRQNSSNCSSSSVTDSSSTTGCGKFEY